MTMKQFKEYNNDSEYIVLKEGVFFYDDWCYDDDSEPVYIFSNEEKQLFFNTSNNKPQLKSKLNHLKKPSIK